MSRELKLGQHVVNDENPAYVIAEVGHNHQGKLETAKEMFRQAQSCGVSAVKLQKRDNRTLFTKAAFDKPYENENSFGATRNVQISFDPAPDPVTRSRRVLWLVTVSRSLQLARPVVTTKTRRSCKDS